MLTTRLSARRSPHSPNSHLGSGSCHRGGRRLSHSSSSLYHSHALHQGSRPTATRLITPPASSSRPSTAVFGAHPTITRDLRNSSRITPPPLCRSPLRHPIYKHSKTTRDLRYSSTSEACWRRNDGSGGGTPVSMFIATRGFQRAERLTDGRRRADAHMCVWWVSVPRVVDACNVKLDARRRRAQVSWQSRRQRLHLHSRRPPLDRHVR